MPRLMEMVEGGDEKNTNIQKSVTQNKQQYENYNLGLILERSQS